VPNIKSLSATPVLFWIFAMMNFGVSAQSWEIGGAIGASNYHGDLAYNIPPKETHF